MLRVVKRPSCRDPKSRHPAAQTPGQVVSALLDCLGARCRAQLLLCSRCDRPTLLRPCLFARSAPDARRAAAQRYQRSRAGHLAHAARSRHWRRRQCAQPERGYEGSTNFVTHQGSPIPAPDAPLPSGEQVASPALIAPHCRRCATAPSPWTRIGFLRHGRVSRWPARVVDPCPVKESLMSSPSS